MTERLDILKTYKLFIDGKFPRTESGRSWPVGGTPDSPFAHVSKASRKDLREAVEAARKAQPAWGNATAYLRGQILYRIAEMMEGKREELAAAIASVGPGGKASKAKKPAKGAARGVAPRDEVTAAIDRVVHYAGWADKYAQVLGCNNPVAGPYYNFTAPEPVGVVAVFAPEGSPLLGLVSLLAPVVCAGNAAVVVSATDNPVPAAVFGEVLATSDVPAGVVNVLTGERTELISHAANHRDIDAIHAANLPAEEATTLRMGGAENVKRVTVRGTESQIDFFDTDVCQDPWWIESFVEMKTMWHPA
ncbi:MAG: aldehyde dehydrogenase family protein, partial [Phycisphaerales bacterium]